MNLTGAQASVRFFLLRKAMTVDALMKLEVVTPEENMGDVIGDLNKRRLLASNFQWRFFLIVILHVNVDFFCAF